MKQTSYARYLFIFFVVYVIASLAVVWVKRSDLLPWIGGCNPAGYDDDHYMAYCHTRRYGDYEHWSFWNSSEPGVIDRVKQANVLFVGNSSTQFGFSTQAVKDFFARNSDISYYVLGFGMGSSSEVVRRLSERFSIKPDVLIVNADPFFRASWNGANRKMVNEAPLVAWEHKVKKWWQGQQAEVCADDKNSFIGGFLCTEGLETVYRSRSTGMWRTDYYRADKRLPVGFSEESIHLLDEAVYTAKAFFESTGISPECTIMTIAPRDKTEQKFAELLATRLGMTTAFANADGLTTVDGFHLSPDSAERWSAEVLEMAEKTIRACVSN